MNSLVNVFSRVRMAGEEPHQILARIVDVRMYVDPMECVVLTGENHENRATP